MNRVVEAIQKMIQTPSGIKDVSDIEGELYFHYKEHTLSVLKRSPSTNAYGAYSLYIYPGNSESFEYLASQQNFSPDEVPIVSYHINELGADGIELLGQLYKVLLDKLYNVDSIIDDILSD